MISLRADAMDALKCLQYTGALKGGKPHTLLCHKHSGKKKRFWFLSLKQRLAYFG
jgi:hypothetical protein